MKAKELQERLQEEFDQRGYQTTWDREQDKFNLEVEGIKEPIGISLPKLLERIQSSKANQSEIIQETLDHIQVMISSVEERKKVRLAGNESKIFPVMRSTSFPQTTANGTALLYDDHTAETRIYYAIDMGKSYTLIDEKMMKEADWNKQAIKEKALFNLRSLPNETKRDTVSENQFYFVNVPDGYAASRILNQSFIQSFKEKVEGDFCLAIPHQDVLILADIRNSAGYDVMGQMGFHFYANGPMPITALPFRYENGNLEPIFIMARRKAETRKDQKSK